ncbi:MAG TPA: DUF1549 domain-containing protein, partial [Pirellulaceae bacterium]|nr:DUF1549 domain-containing protein [Pirellulaceae bacterium]
MIRPKLKFAGMLLLLAAPCFVGAAELLPPESDPAVVIDHYIDAKLQAAGVTPAPLADDSALLRRTLLDLEGRTPTATEAQAYLANKEPNKRTSLVDAALASPRFVRHQVDEFDVMLSGLGKSNLKQYLKLAMTENRPWDQIFRELLLAEEATPAQAGAKQFLKTRLSDLDRLANETSVIFFGVNISCAKCHDHPLVKSWTQEHFYGMASFFNRTFEHGDFLGERGYGRVDYQTTSGENRTAKLMFLTGTYVEEPEAAEPKDAEKKAEKELLEKLKKEKQAPPSPSFSRRAKLV